MNNTDDVISILALLIVLLVFIIFVFCVLATLILSSISTHRFYIAAYKSLDRENANKRTQSIRNDYEVYRKRRYGMAWKDIISLCQELASKLKSRDSFRGEGIPKHSIEELEEVIELLKDDYSFEDEKINSVINEINQKTNAENARIIREYIIRFQAYCQGQLFEKDREKQNCIDKMERKKWFNRICGIIGIVGSIVSIYSFFQ